MCGRFSLRLDRDDIFQQIQDYDADVDEWIDEDEFVPRYNIAPRTQVPVIRNREPGEGASGSGSGSGSRARAGAGESSTAPGAQLVDTNADTDTVSRPAEPASTTGSGTQPSSQSDVRDDESARHGKEAAKWKGKGKNAQVLHTMKWGLVPHWSKHEDKSLNTINARAENLVEGVGMWGSIKGRKRCAIPVQGYYEWQTKGKEKIPHFTKRSDGKVLLLAGLYDCVQLEGKNLWTFTIVTTDANKGLSWLHDRQPVILSSHDALVRWLDTSSQTWTPELSKMVQPYGDELASQIQCYAVPKEVGKVGTESSTFIEPVSARKDGIAAMFAKQEKKTPSPKKPATKPSPAQSSKKTVKAEKLVSPPSSPTKKEPMKSEPKSASKFKKEESSPQSSKTNKAEKMTRKRKAVATTTIDLTNDDEDEQRDTQTTSGHKRPKTETS